MLQRARYGARGAACTAGAAWAWRAARARACARAPVRGAAPPAASTSATTTPASRWPARRRLSARGGILVYTIAHWWTSPRHTSLGDKRSFLRIEIYKARWSNGVSPIPYMANISPIVREGLRRCYFLKGFSVDGSYIPGQAGKFCQKPVARHYLSRSGKVINL